MQDASDENASSSAAENSDVEFADKSEESDDEGSEQPSPSLFRQKQADENDEDSQEDDDSEENERGYASCPDLCNSSDEDEDEDEYINHPNQIPRHHLPQRQRKNPFSRNFPN